MINIILDIKINLKLFMIKIKTKIFVVNIEKINID